MSQQQPQQDWQKLKAVQRDRGFGPGAMRPMGRPRDARKTLLRLLGTLRGRVGWLAVALVMTGVSSLAGIAGTWMLKPLINGLVGGVSSTELMLSLARMALIYGVGALATYFSSRIMVNIAQRTTHDIRERLFNHLQELPLGYFDGHTHGELMSRFTNDVENVNMALEQSLSQAIMSIISIVGTFTMMVILSPLLTVFIVLMLAVMFFVLKTVGKKSSLYFRGQQKSLGELNGLIEEMMEGQKIVKVFNHESAACAEFRRRNEALRRASTDAQTYAGILMPIMGNLSYINYAVTAMVGAILSIHGAMDIGTIAAFLQYTRSFSQPITMVSNQMNMLLAALAGAERIFNVMDEIPEPDKGGVTLILARRTAEGDLEPAEGDPFADFRSFAAAAADNAAQGETGGGQAPTPQNSTLLAWRVPGEPEQLIELRGDVRFEDVVFGYVPDTTVLHAVSLYAKPGQKIAFVGSTGAGKTTITNLINRFYEIQQGRITYDGIDIRRIRKADLRRTLGMVLQDVHLFAGTIRDNIRYGKLNATDEQIEEAAVVANAHSFITRLPDGYDTVLAPDGINLSQGQRQLLSIARAAVADPPVIILDEATSSIDTRTERLIEQGMDRLMHDRTTFVIAHRLSTVRNAKAILVLEHGQIIERGNHGSLLDGKGRYYQLYTGAAELT